MEALYEQQQKRVAQLALVSAISREASSILDLDELLDRTAHAIHESFGYHDVLVAFVDHEAGELVRMSRAGPYQDKAPKGTRQKLDPEKGIINQVALTGQTRLVNDVTREPRYEALFPETRSELCVPIKTREKIIGILNVESDCFNAFDESDVVALETLAHQLAVAIEKGSLYQAEQRRRRTAETLRQVAAALSSTLDLKQVLDLILEHLAQVVPYDSATVMLVSDEALRVMAARGFPDIERTMRVAIPLADDALFQEMVHTGRPVVLADAQKDERFQAAGETTYVRGWIGAPLVVKGQVIGNLTVDSREPGAYGPEEAEIVAALAHQAAIAIENARLYEEVKCQAERMAVVDRIARAAGATLHLDELVETVYQEVARVFQADAFFLALYDERTNELDYRLRVDEGIREPPVRRPLRRGLTALVITEKRSILIRDFEREKDHLPPARVWGTMKVSPSWLGVPMLIGDRVVGVISVQAYHPAAYGQEEEQLLSTIADQVAVAVENARLYEETRRRLTREERLNELAHTLGGEMELAVLMPRLLSSVVELTGADAATFAVLDPDRQVVAYPYHYNLPEALAGLEVPTGSGLAWHTMQVRQPMLLNDYREHPAALQPWLEAGARSVLTVPLVAGDQVMGSLGLFSLGEVRPFGPEAVAAAEAAARLAAVAIQRARLYEETTRRAETLAALHKISLDLAAQRALPDLLEAIVARAVALLDARGGALYLYRPATDDLEYVVAYNLEPDFIGTVLKRGDGLSGKVLETGLPMAVDNYSKWEGRAAQYEGVGFTACVAVPVCWRDRLLGVLNVLDDAPRTFSPADIVLLERLTPLAAAALEQTRLLEEERARRREAETLREAALALTTTLERNEVVERILGQLQQAVPFDTASVQLLKGDRLEIIGGRGFPNLPELLGISFPVDGDNPNREVMHRRLPFILEDAPMVYDEFRREPHAQANIHSWLGVPMLVGERLVGMIALDKEEVGFYTEQHARLALAFATQAAIVIENARLFEEERRRATQLAVVNEVGRHAASTLELNQMLRNVTIAIQTGFGYYTVGTFLVEGEHAVLKTIAGGLAPLVQDGYRQHLSQGLIGWAITHDQTVLVNDVSRDPRFISGPLPGRLVQSELCVPIRADDEVIGALNVESTKLNAFDQWDVMALEILADQIASAVKNALTYGRLDEEKGRLELLYEVAAEVNRSLDLDEILARAIERITVRLGGRVGYIFLVEPGTDRIRLRAASGVKVSIPELNKLLDVHLGQGVIGWVAAHREPAVVEDVTQDERWLYVDELDRGIRSVMSVPLMRGEEALGALSVLHPRPGFFDQAQCRLLMAIAQQVAVAVANARLHETVRKQALLDSLTQVYNHGELIRRLHLAVEEAARRSQPVSFIMLDIDFFKEYNDRYGHVTGDLILTAIVQAIRANIKKSDVVGRWGGEEFGIVLPRTDSAHAQMVAERIRHTLATMLLTDDKGREVPKPTVSQGIATYPTTAASAEELIDLADAALYRAKARGKDQVHVA